MNFRIRNVYLYSNCRYTCYALSLSLSLSPLHFDLSIHLYSALSSTRYGTSHDVSSLSRLMSVARTVRIAVRDEPLVVAERRIVLQFVMNRS